MESSNGKSNGSSPNQDRETTSFTGDQGGPSSDASNTRTGKDGENCKGKNHQPSNEKIGGVFPASTTGELFPETTRMDFDTAAISESPQNSPTTRNTNRQEKDGKFPPQNKTLQSEIGSALR